MVWGLGFRVSEFGFGVILGLPDRSPCCVLCLWYPLVVQAVSSSLTSSAAWTLGFFCGLSWWLACSDQVAASTTNPDDLAGISSGHGRRRVAATALRSVLIPKPKLRPRPWLVLCFCKHSTYLQRCVEVASLTMTCIGLDLGLCALVAVAVSFCVFAFVQAEADAPDPCKALHSGFGFGLVRFP